MLYSGVVVRDWIWEAGGENSSLFKVVGTGQTGISPENALECSLKPATNHWHRTKNPILSSVAIHSATHQPPRFRDKLGVPSLAMSSFPLSARYPIVHQGKDHNIKDKLQPSHTHRAEPEI